MLPVLSNPNLPSTEGSMHVEYHYSNHVVLVGGLEHAETKAGTKVGKRNSLHRTINKLNAYAVIKLSTYAADQVITKSKTVPCISACK